MRYYDALLGMLEERGVTRETALGRAGLSRERVAREDGFLSIDEVEALVLATARLAPDRDVPLALGRRLHLPSHGALGMAALTAATFDRAIWIAQRYFPLVTPLFSIDYQLEGPSARVVLRRTWPLDPLVERVHVEVILSSLHAMTAFLLGSFPKGIEVDVAHPQSSELPSWFEKSGLQIAFSRPTTELRVPRALIETKFPLADARAHASACRTCDELLAAMPLPDRTTSEVRRVLEDEGPPFVDLESVARTLRVSSRTLRRRLADEDASFRGVLDEVRVALAEKWLLAGDRSITAIGLELGYTDAANFTRAFRRLRGTSPLGFQRASRGE